MNRTCRAMICAMMLGAALPLLANPMSPASPANVAIEPQPLASALQALARQSNVQIIFFSKAVEGLPAPALNGTYTPEEAVARLLEGSGLTYHVLNDRAIEVTAVPLVTANSVAANPDPAASPGFAAKPVTPSAAAPARAAQMREVKVVAPREKLDAIREELQGLKEQFFAAYNSVNTSDQYDVTCTTEKRRHGRAARRICEPAYVQEAVREAAAARAHDPCAPSARQIVLLKTLHHLEEMRDVVEKHPELKALQAQRQELAERYGFSRKGSVESGALEADAKNAIVSSRASAAALVATIGRCLSKERSLRNSSTEVWAIAKGLEPVEIEGTSYFCLRQPDVAQPIRNTLTCASLADLREARFPRIPGSSSSDFGGFDYPVEPTPGSRMSFAEQAALHGVSFP